MSSLSVYARFASSRKRQCLPACKWGISSIVVVLVMPPNHKYVLMILRLKNLKPPSCDGVLTASSCSLPTSTTSASSTSSTSSASFPPSCYLASPLVLGLQPIIRVKPTTTEPHIADKSAIHDREQHTSFADFDTCFKSLLGQAFELRLIRHACKKMADLC